MRQTYKLGNWTASESAPTRDVLYSPSTRRIFTPRLGDRKALEFAKNVSSLASAIKQAETFPWIGVFRPVEGGSR